VPDPPERIPSQPAPDPRPGGAEDAPPAEEVTGLPVLAEPRPVEPARPAPLPAAVAAATGGFLLGVATFLLVRVLRRPRAARVRRGRGLRRRGERIEVAATRSFLVDVHLLNRR
jgi:hypothetical protein